MNTTYLHMRPNSTKWGEVFFTGCYYSFDSDVELYTRIYRERNIQTDGQRVSLRCPINFKFVVLRY